MGKYRRFALESWRDGILQRAILVAAIVGTVLNLINQGDAFMGGRPIDWAKVFLTYLVPFCVSTHGALSVRRPRA